MIIMVAGCGERGEGINSSMNKFVKSLKIGWNPDNTFDAYSDQNKEDEINSPNCMYLSPEYVERSKAYVAATWLQLATEFAEYDNLSIME